jgi:hypothetical protein
MTKEEGSLDWGMEDFRSVLKHFGLFEIGKVLFSFIIYFQLNLKHLKVWQIQFVLHKFLLENI